MAEYWKFGEKLLLRSREGCCNVQTSRLPGGGWQELAEGNAKSLKYSAHTFKGGSASLGAVGVVEVCRELEVKAKNQNFVDIDPLVQLLEERYEEARQELVKFLWLDI